MLKTDLDLIDKFINQEVQQQLYRKEIIVFGGTGFLGKNLLEVLIYINKRYQLELNISVTSRNPEQFIKDYPNIGIEVNLIKLDILSKPETWSINQIFDICIHSACPTTETTVVENDKLMYQTIIEGTNNILNFCNKNLKEKFIYLSSGAIYGKHSPSEQGFDENFNFQVLEEQHITHDYRNGKRESEKNIINFFNNHQANASIVRCFSFIGPYLPLDSYFAIGNFINNALKGGDIIIKSDGKAIRSYLYTVDAAIYIIKMMIHSQDSVEIYNLGASKTMNLKEIAELIKNLINRKISISILGSEIRQSSQSIYYPNMDFTRNNLKIDLETSIETSIKNTINFLSQHQELN